MLQIILEHFHRIVGALLIPTHVTLDGCRVLNGDLGPCIQWDSTMATLEVLIGTILYSNTFPHFGQDSSLQSAWSLAATSASGLLFDKPYSLRRWR